MDNVMLIGCFFPVTRFFFFRIFYYVTKLSEWSYDFILLLHSFIYRPFFIIVLCFFLLKELINFIRLNICSSYTVFFYCKFSECFPLQDVCQMEHSFGSKMIKLFRTVNESI